MLFPGKESHSQRGQISSTVRFFHKSAETFIKCMALATKEVLPQIPNPCSGQVIHCNVYFVQPSEMSDLPHLQTKCHHLGAGIKKKKKVLSVPLFFHSVLPPGTELLPFCTCLLLPIFLIFTVLVQIFTPATDFCPSLLQYQRITENSKIQCSHF